jgi:hypothetical protein
MNIVHNAGYGLRFLKPKIFLIGFNKCGTTSLHKFFRNQGLKSAHCWIGNKSLAVEAARHSDAATCRKIFASWQVFSDFTFLKEKTFIEPLDLYPVWRHAFPNAYFILNDRNIDEWVRSRLVHKDGDFLKRYLIYSGCDETAAVAHWRAKFLAHKEEVLSFFKDDKRFCHFTLGQDDISKIIDFLGPDYRLNADMFITRNSRRAENA